MAKTADFGDKDLFTIPRILKMFEREYNFKFDSKNIKKKNYLERIIREYLKEKDFETKQGSGWHYYKKTVVDELFKDRNMIQEFKNIINENPKELYSTDDIIKGLEDNYGTKLKKDVRKLFKRTVQRFMQNNYEHEKKMGSNSYHYSPSVFDEVLSDEELNEKFRKVMGKKGSYKTNAELSMEQKTLFRKKEKELYELWEKAGLTPEEGNYLQFDRFNRQEYLMADELLFLGLKGMHTRDSLSDEEKEKLELYRQHKEMEEFNEKEIKRLYKEIKMEIMVTALFNEHFFLDEEKLLKDIRNYVYGGEFSLQVVGSSPNEKSKRTPSQAVRRSFLRLQKKMEYVKKKQQ